MVAITTHPGDISWILRFSHQRNLHIFVVVDLLLSTLVEQNNSDNVFVEISNIMSNCCPVLYLKTQVSSFYMLQ